MKISDALFLARQKFQQNKIESFALDALLLLCAATSSSKEKIIFNPDLELTLEQENIFLDFVARRSACEPVSHILQKREFFGLDFFVNKNVLDPRADSEALIELVLEKIDKNRDQIFLEIGVGSGALVISLLKNLPNSLAFAIDISLPALDIARQNAIAHNVLSRLQLIESNLFSKIPAQKFDFIISNPPYIKSLEIENLSDDVRLFEPLLALDGGVDGLDFYRHIAKNSAQFLVPKGVVFLEIGSTQKKAVIEIFTQNNFFLKSEKRDLAGLDRALEFIV